MIPTRTTLVDDMRKLVHLLESAQEDGGLRAPQRDQLERIILKRKLRRDPPVAIAPTPYGTIYRVSESMMDDPKSIDLLGFNDPDFINKMIQLMPLGVQFTAMFYVPDECVIVFESDRIMKMVWTGNGLGDDKSLLDFLVLAANALSPKVEFDRIARIYLWQTVSTIRDADVIRGKDGRWEPISVSLRTENQKVLVPGLGECWNVTNDWVSRARHWLHSHGVNAPSLLRNSNRFFLATAAGVPVLVAFRDGDLMGVRNTRLSKDALAKVGKHVSDYVQSNYPSTSPKRASKAILIRPNTIFHSMLSFIAANPGLTRRGWRQHVGRTGMSFGFSQDEDGMATRLGLITAKRTARSYELAITDRGRDVLSRLSRNEPVDVAELV